MEERRYCVYIMTNAHNTVLYTGVTNHLQRRVLEHRAGEGGAFTRKYNLHKLVYFEYGNDVNTAIIREKQIKAGSRQKKIDLVNSMNPDLNDLYEKSFSNAVASDREAISSEHKIASSGKAAKRPRNDSTISNGAHLRNCEG